ncbi:serine hydrolase domain-containing protein [Neobacillus ginsengisoli]|uniref:CubicO group peptidase (Beta-lactamase class C family) n=1 Tax=Neobacillus ginsengisoli TaxID=904295 RepID=A0ABT9Y3T1_9BACI|nr:serine hydrolase domain-containing protein [Neobacillus ginsengisoli]MDQ0202201.1 CubicO group peptidase (beta-lactamase class C family) [Neobacillus ginsengisoli]
MRIKKSVIWIFGVLIGVLILFTAAVITFGSTVHSDLKGNIQQKLGAFMDKKADANQFNGVVLVAKDGKVLFEKGYGFANSEEGVPNQIDTEFRIASLTKSFTAVSILQLENQGKLKTSDPISKYIANFPNGDKITIHDLLTHSSGVADHLKLTDTTQPITMAAFIDLMRKQKLEFSPGSEYKYSNTGYMILADIIETVSGESYGDYYQDHIFKPAGMYHTYLRKAETKKFALGYENMRKITERDDESQLAGYGDIISTVHDLLKYNNAIQNDKLLSTLQVEKMETGYIDSASWGIFKYGYGWNVADNFISFGRPLIEHNGSLPGYKSDLADFVKDRVTVIVLSNNHGTWNTGELSRELASICLGKRFWFYQKYF